MLFVGAFFVLSLVLILAGLTHRNQLLIKLQKQKIKNLQTDLHDKQTSFDTLFSHSTIGVGLLRLDGKFLKANNTLCEILGYNYDDLIERNFFNILNTESLREIHHHIQQMLDLKTDTFETEQVCLDRNSESLWLLITLSLIKDENDEANYFILQVKNNSLLKLAEERLKNISYHDTLTGLPNRNKFEQELHHFIALSQRHDAKFGVLYIDLDRFRNIGESVGREASNAIIQIIAQRITKGIRNTDLIARLENDEFVILVADIKRVDAVGIIAEKILMNICQPIMVNGKELFITASIGISMFPEDGGNVEELMHNADAALYRAKDYGRNNYQFYNTEVSTRVRDKLALQNALANALLKNEFTLNYQPVMELATRKIVGVEALIRWKNKEFGVITPSEIVALTEETGVIIPVSEWVLTLACKRLMVWHSMGYKNLNIAINCSERQFKQATFVDDIINVIKQSRIPAFCLELEVTERLIMEDPEKTLRTLNILKDLGIKIVIDDFGSGYWSWGNLKRLRVDKIKIDKLFVKQVIDNETVAKLTAGLISMINKLGIISVAEGVETKEQYEFLLKEGCQQIQGYYISQPVTEEVLTEFLKHPIPDAEAVS